MSLALNGQSTHTECSRYLNFSWQRSKHWIWHTLLRWPKFFWRLFNSNYTFLEMVYLMHDNGCRVISLGWKPNKPLPKFPISFTSHHDIFFFHQHAEVVSCKRKHKRKSCCVAVKISRALAWFSETFRCNLTSYKTKNFSESALHHIRKL